MLEKLRKEGESKFVINEQGVLTYQSYVWVPKVDGMCQQLMQIAHSSSYAMCISSNKMNQDLKVSYWWEGMKRDITEFAFYYLTCQQVKVEH